MPTSKLLRQPPTRNFSDYKVVYITDKDVNISSIPENKFIDPDPLINYDDYFGPLDLGFNFEFNGITYNKVVLHSNPIAILVDPTQVDSFDIEDIINVSDERGSTFKSTITNNHAIFCAWVKARYNITGDGTYFTFDDFYDLTDTNNPTRNFRTKYGIEPSPYNLTDFQHGLRYCYSNSKYGKCLIARWNSINSGYKFANQSTIVEATNNYTYLYTKCEIIIYENGKIEYRYVPKNEIKDFTRFDDIYNSQTFSSQGEGPIEKNVCGMFFGGENNFRDFSNFLNYRNTSNNSNYPPTEYINGGSVYSSNHTDIVLSGSNTGFYAVTSSYCSGLQTHQHWPGTKLGGGIFVIEPPQNKRRILPKNALNFKENIDQNDKFNHYDDRKTINFNEQIISYPTNLPISLKNSIQSSYDKCDLLNALDIIMTGNINKYAIEQFHTYENSFDLNNSMFEDQYHVDYNKEFYVSGSKVEDVGVGFSQNLLAKDKIVLTLPVDLSIKMLETTGCIYYYDSKRQQFHVPLNSSWRSNIFWDRYSDYAIQQREYNNNLYDSFANNDFIQSGVDAVGNIVTDASAGILYNAFVGSLNTYIDTYFSHLISKHYSAYKSELFDETITVNIDKPFLIEKAIIEIPFEFGPGWFNDYTTTELGPINSEGYDEYGIDRFGGPGLTVQLLDEIDIGTVLNNSYDEFGYETAKNYFNNKIRNVILSGTITHVYDYKSDLSASVTFNDNLILKYIGFKSYSEPTAVVYPNVSTNQYTGSVKLECNAAVSNGYALVVNRYDSNPTYGPSTQYIPLRTTFDNPANGYYVGNFKNIGRSGVNLLSKNIHSPLVQDSFFRSIIIDDLINPIVDPKLNPNNEGETMWNDYSGYNKKSTAYRYISKTKNSPYLLMPGNNLILAISKTMPAIYSSSLKNPEYYYSNFYSGSINRHHDVKLKSGEIKVTLFGSYVKENKEYHMINQKNNSNSIYDNIIGNEPVLDQFEGFYKSSYYHSYTDDYITGSLVSYVRGPGGKLLISTGSRGRVFSKTLPFIPEPS